MVPDRDLRLERHPRLEHHRVRADESEGQRLVDDPRLAEAPLGVVVKVLLHPGLGADLALTIGLVYMGE